jgi:hypothetical protein
MAYICQFCGEIEDGDIAFRCGGCGGENILRSANSMTCRECEDTEIVAVCPTCGSEELEK